MRRIIALAVFLFSFNSAMPQVITENKTNPYIDGAKVIVDILHLFKKGGGVGSNTSQSTNTNNTCNFCIYNSDSLQSLKITLVSKNQQFGDTLRMVVKRLNKECSLRINCGVYNCKIEFMDNRIISWGDVLINEKEMVLVK